MILFLFFIFFSLIKSILSILFYPIAYLFRDIMITKQVLYNGYLYQYKRFWFLLWLFENDSERFDYLYGIPTGSGYYPKWLYNSCYQLDTKWKRFAMAYWFNGIRNSMVNFNNYMMMITGECCGYEWYIGCDSWEKLKQQKKGFRLEKRIFWSGYRQKFCKRLYLEFYLFGRWYQFGWLKRGRFEIDLWKKK